MNRNDLFKQFLIFEGQNDVLRNVWVIFFSYLTCPNNQKILFLSLLIIFVTHVLHYPTKR